MGSSQFCLVFLLPNQPKQYFRREAEVLVAGRARIVPELTFDVRQAHRFNPESAVQFRDRYREQYAGNGYEIRVEDPHGIQQFERESQPESPTEDNRVECLVEPDGLENSGL